MIEFNVRILSDTQDPEQAYKELRAALQYTGLYVYIPDTWLKNNEPLPADCAQRIALAWQKRNPPQKRVRFSTNDPVMQTRVDYLNHNIDVLPCGLGEV